MCAITDFPSEVLGLISDYLPGYIVIRLLITGNALLEAKMRVGVSALSFRLSRDAMFSFSVLTLPRLRSLCVHMEDRHGFYPIPMHIPLDLKGKATKSLKRLELKTILATTLYFSDSGSFSLCSAFRDLESLSLINCLPNFDIDNLRALPTRLKYLKIDRAFGLWVVVHSLRLKDIQLAQLLPRTLEYLFIRTITIAPSDESTHLRSSWPENLRSLILANCLGSSILEGLPSRLEELNLVLLNSIAIQQVLSSSLPQTLRRVDLRSSRALVSVIRLDVPLPPQLESWSGEIEVDEALDLEVGLPKSLKLIQSNTAFHTLFMARQAFKSLPALETLEFNLSNDIEPPWTTMPSQLTSLSLPLISMPLLEPHVLPDTLTHLRANLSADFDLHALPRGLKELDILEGYQASGVFALSSWCGIPPTLGTLRVSIDMIMTPDHFNMLPKTLINLRLHISALQDPNVPLLSTMPIGALLPSSLEDLYFYIGVRQSLDWRKWFFETSDHLSALRSLNVTENYYHRTHDTYDYLKSLPRSLKELSVPLGPEFGKNNFLSFLPPHLEILNFSTASNLDTPIEFHQSSWENLPESLVTLNVPSLQNCTASFFQTIPKHIEDITILVPTNVSPEFTRYYEASHWLGHARANPQLPHIVTQIAPE